jgi:hypothetical protein
MKTNIQPAPRLMSTGFGLLMVTAAAVYADGLELLAAAIAVGAVLAGLVFRVAATLAVVFAVGLIVASGASPLFAAVSGMAAAAYLVVRHAIGGPGGGVTMPITMTRPTSLAIVGFTFVGVVATSVPLQLPWLPLLAPPAAVAMYLIASRAFISENNAEPAGRE